MMIRRFNYTGRVKIPRSRVSISLLRDKEGKYFTASVNLEGLNLPNEARIYIEPNYKGVYQRFFFGTVERLIVPDNTRLSELPETELAFFDISVVDERSEIGRLLAKARGIPVSTNDHESGRIPLLPVNPVDLGHQFWKLSFDASNDQSPILEINRNIPEVFEMVRTDIKFIALVYPVAFRGVLYKLIEIGDFDAPEDSWMNLWIKFLKTVLGITYFPAIDDETEGITEEQNSWIDLCVNEYSKRLHLFQKFTDA